MTEQSSHVNVLYLHSHDTGRYIQPYGMNLQTPHLQRLAERGMLFRQAFCANPTCSPSRAALLTGQYPHNNGMLGLAHRGAGLREPGHTLPSYLRDNGYATALAGLQHVWHKQTADIFGYSRNLHDEYSHIENGEGAAARDLATVERAKTFLAEQAKDQPFFLDVGFFTTHRLGRTPEGWQCHNDGDSIQGDSRYTRPPLCLPDTPETRADFADYAVAVQRLDNYMGEVLEALADSELAENTLVVCTTDHGIAFPKMKCNLTDHGTGVMLVLAGPAGGRRAFDGGRVCDSMVGHLDIFPTVCDAVGLPHPDWLQGRSLQPLAEDESRELHEELFAEVNYHAAREPMRAVRTSRYKYIKRLAVLEHPVLPNCDSGPSKSMLLQHGWGEQGQEKEQLFDLLFDPQEVCNRIADPAYAETAMAMRDRLLRWQEQTNDPALSGEVRLPGYLCNPVDGLHPGNSDLISEEYRKTI